MATFNRGGKSRFGGQKGGFQNDSQRGSRFTGRDSNRPRFEGGEKGKPWNDRGGAKGKLTMYEATCSNCGRSCEVPFRPAPGSAVYCKECFAKNGDMKGRGEERAAPPRRDFRNNAPSRPPFEAPKAADGMQRELASLHGKLDRLAEAVEALTRRLPALETMAAKRSEAAEPAEASALEKKPKKAARKAATKKGKKQ
jgi:CxxC-x17-CxxC domain-containing protein